jgi:hypothetical protein
MHRKASAGFGLCVERVPVVYQRNVEAYIDEFKDLIDLSRYTDPITIVLKFR